MWLLPVDPMEHRWVTLLSDYPFLFFPLDFLLLLGFAPQCLSSWWCDPFAALQLFFSALTHFSGLSSGSFPSLVLLGDVGGSKPSSDKWQLLTAEFESKE